MKTYYFNRDVKFNEFNEAGINLIDNRLRAADFNEAPFIIKQDDSFVMIEKYKPTENGNINDYTTDRVIGKGFGGDVLTKIANMGIKITPEK